MADDLDSNALQDAVFTADVDDENYTPPTEDAEEPEVIEETDETTETEEIEEEKETPEKPDKTSELEAQLAEATKEINRLGYALRKDKDKPKTDEKDTPFTKAQLMQLYRENSENPEVVFQIMDEMTKLGKMDAQEAAEKSADIRNKKVDMDKLLNTMFPEAQREGTPLNVDVEKAVKWLHLDDHPFKDFLAMASLTLHQLPNTLKNIREQAIADAQKAGGKDLAAKAESARKKGITEKKATGSSKPKDASKPATLTHDQMETAKRLGITTKAQLAKYAKILKVKGETVHSEG